MNKASISKLGEKNPMWKDGRTLDSKKYAREYSRAWRKKNPEKANANCKKWRDTHKQKHYELSTNWRKNNLEKSNAIARKSMKKRRLNIKVRLDHSIEVMIGQSLKGKKEGHHWENLVGYTLYDLMKHLEKQFDDKMNWNNYAFYWTIDHIKPRSLFDYSSFMDREFKNCWSLNNLRPLEKIENIKKSNKFIFSKL